MRNRTRTSSSIGSMWMSEARSRIAWLTTRLTSWITGAWSSRPTSAATAASFAWSSARSSDFTSRSMSASARYTVSMNVRTVIGSETNSLIGRPAAVSSCSRPCRRGVGAQQHQRAALLGDGDSAVAANHLLVECRRAALRG